MLIDMSLEDDLNEVTTCENCANLVIGYCIRLNFNTQHCNSCECFSPCNNTIKNKVKKIVSEGIKSGW